VRRHAIWSTENNVSGLGLTVPIAVLTSHGSLLLCLCYTKFIPLTSVYMRFAMEKVSYRHTFFPSTSVVHARFLQFFVLNIILVLLL